MIPTPPLRRRILAVVITLLAGAMLAPAAASAAKIHALGPWHAQNTYRVETDLDGRTAPQLDPVKKVNHLKAGQWVHITCQVPGQSAYGSKVWAKVNGLYVPDHFVKTYTDGFIPGVPTCGSGAPKPDVPTTPVQPAGPSMKTLTAAAKAVEFERVYGSNYRIYKTRYPSSVKAPNGRSIDWGTNGCSVPRNAIVEHTSLGAWLTGKALGYYSRLFKKSCDRHDFGYRNYGPHSPGLRIGGGETRRLSIDRRLHANMKIQCSHVFSRKVVEYVQRHTCDRAADVFYEAVHHFAKGHFSG